MWWFQLTRSRGAWQNSFVQQELQGNFNSHAHVERDITPPWSIFTISDFNSHAHVERDQTIPKWWYVFWISTHTLTWSVTLVVKHNSFIVCIFQLTRSRGAWQGHFSIFINCKQISTHTLTWSVTGVLFHIHQLNTNFNSHAHVERDPLAEFIYLGFFISTHTLTWSVTFGSTSISLSLQFQLTRSRGAWLDTFSQVQYNIHFNSHAHVERDISLLLIQSCRTHFNSHAHVERDDLRTYGAQVMNISTHTLTWSVTFQWFQYFQW